MPYMHLEQLQVSSHSTILYKTMQPILHAFLRLLVITYLHGIRPDLFLLANLAKEPMVHWNSRSIHIQVGCALNAKIFRLLLIVTLTLYTVHNIANGMF